ncbi:BatD family protein [Marinibactrum halimedae]|uniref:DUF7939 domain-containing protein n=1 Tax=Marinibactrum halimedae TaxID=1444977 RepID=A0AA37T668_9GAMM|nr:BatD family protein [Marinibactrum halimedae]MCD9458581.1 BatD family protein [Marinibactrum halimedae]GLS26551.1 hypothetical protein GCM10007877_22670 [Marinibactrum halimedae]
MKRFSFPLITSIRFINITALLCFLLVNPAYADELSAEVDRRTLSIEETLNLTVRFKGNANYGDPDFSDLDIAFDVLNQSRSNQFRSFNGRGESWTEWNLIIAPKETGKLLIPSFQLGQHFSDAIEITVNKGQANAGNTAKDVFIEVLLDTQEAYVQEQILVNVRFHTSVAVGSISSDDLNIPNAKVEQLSEQRYRNTIDGREYAIVEWVYGIYPQQSGQLEIPPLTWEIMLGRRSTSLFDPFNNRRNAIRRLRTERKSLTVLPKPASYPANTNWLPAKSITLEEQWPGGANFVQGEPITRTIVFTADGLSGSQLPELPIQYPNTINHYPEPEKADEQKSRLGMVTTVSQNHALVATQPGDYTLPPLTVTWWNTQTDQLETTTLPAKKITVLAAPNTSGTNAANLPQAATDNDSNNASLPSEITPPEAVESVGSSSTSTGIVLLLIASNVITILIALFFAYLWFKQPRLVVNQETLSQHPDTTNERKCFKALEQHCKAGDAKAVREALITWANAKWPSESHRILEDVAGKLNASAWEILKLLDATLYQSEPSSTPAVDYSALLDAIKQARNHKAQNTNTHSLQALNAA